MSLLQTVTIDHVAEVISQHSFLIPEDICENLQDGSVSVDFECIVALEAMFRGSSSMSLWPRFFAAIPKILSKER